MNKEVIYAVRRVIEGGFSTKEAAENMSLAKRVADKQSK
jgi:hypothetical protein